MTTGSRRGPSRWSGLPWAGNAKMARLIGALMERDNHVKTFEKSVTPPDMKKAPSAAPKLTYLDSASWSVDSLLYGENGIAVLTFSAVPILPAQSSP